jgi:hypothetical protein
LLGAIRCLAAFTTTHLVLGDREGLGLCTSTTADFFCLPITASHLQDTCLGACTLAESTPRTFAIFWAARKVTGFGVNVTVFVVAVASTRGGGNIHLENSALFASWTTFCTTRTITTIGALTPVLPVALAVLLAWLCAARMDLLGTACCRANFAAMAGGSGDRVHPFLNSTTTGGRTRAVLSPTSITVNCACFGVACTLFFVSITMRAINSTFHTIEKCVCAGFQASAAFSGALPPLTPSATNMGSLICWFLGHDGWKWPSWLGGGWSWSWLGVRVVCQSARTALPRTLGCLVARLPARCLLVTLVIALVPLDALLLGELIAQFARIDGPWSESSACGSRPRLFGIHFARLVAHFLQGASLVLAPKIIFA